MLRSCSTLSTSSKPKSGSPGRSSDPTGRRDKRSHKKDGPTKDTPARNAHAPKAALKTAKGKGKEELPCESSEEVKGGTVAFATPVHVKHSSEKHGGPSRKVDDALLERLEQLQGEIDAQKELLQTKKDDEEKKNRHQEAMIDITRDMDISRSVKGSFAVPSAGLAMAGVIPLVLAKTVGLASRLVPSFLPKLSGAMTTMSRSMLIYGGIMATSAAALACLRFDEITRFRYEGGAHVGTDDDMRADTNALLSVKHNSVIGNFEVTRSQVVSIRGGLFPEASRILAKPWVSYVIMHFGKEYRKPIELHDVPICLELVSQALGGHSIHTDLKIAAMHISTVCKRNCTVNIDRKYALLGQLVPINSDFLAQQLNAVATDDIKKLDFREQPHA